MDSSKKKKIESEYLESNNCTWQSGVLHVSGVLNSSQFSSFQKAFDKLLDSDEIDVLLDFTYCRYLSSMFMGKLVDGIQNAKEMGKNVRVIVSPEVGKFLEMAQLHFLFDFEVVAHGKMSYGSGLMQTVS